MIRDASLRRQRIAMNVAGIAFVLILVALCIPTLDGPHKRQYANEASAVGTLRKLASLEHTFAAQRSGRGYTCDFLRLKEVVSSDEYDPGRLNQLASSGARAGYRFAFTNCRTDAAGNVEHYQITAVPNELGKSGFRAFCLDESGVIWHNKSGSASDCLANRKPLD